MGNEVSITGKKDVDDYMEEAMDLLQTEVTFMTIWVSIGSGYGVWEKRMWSERGIQIRRVDPLDPDDFFAGYGRPRDITTAAIPEFKNAMVFKEFLENEGLYDNFQKYGVLILNWPSPSGPDDYAPAALLALLPQYILINYASCGAAGSETMQYFMHTCGAPWDGMLSKSNFALNGQYHVIYQKQRVFGTGRGFTGKTLDVVILQKNDTAKVVESGEASKCPKAAEFIEHTDSVEAEEAPVPETYKARRRRKRGGRRGPHKK